MRLTIHHSSQLAADWQDSLAKLIAPDDLDAADLKAQGQWHLATFNNRVVGLAVTRDGELVYLAVRDITRRRGVGRYLLSQTLAWLRAQGIGQARLDLATVRAEEQPGLIAFLVQAGFEQQGAILSCTL